MGLIADGMVKNLEMTKQPRFEEINHEFIEHTGHII